MKTSLYAEKHMLYKVAFDSRIKDSLNEIKQYWSYDDLSEVYDILEDFEEIDMIDQYYLDQETQNG